AFAQEFRGTVAGRVLDGSGAVLPGTTVSAVNEDTGAALGTVTNEQGIYRIPFLLPGNYRLTVEPAGVKKVERPGVRVSVGSVVALDFTLEVAALSEKVTITAAAPLLNTSNAELGQVVERVYVENVPVSLTRNAVNRVFLAPGVTGDTGTVTSN